MTDNSIIHKKTIRYGYAILINYYYYIEDSIIKIIKTTFEYLHPSTYEYTSNEEFGDYVVVNVDDKLSPPPQQWINNNLLTSIRESIYIPSNEYTSEQLIELGYKPIATNENFKANLWNCYIYSDHRKYEILSEFIDLWDIKKLNIHLISGPYNEDEYQLFKDFNTDMSFTPNVQFHSTHLHDFTKDELIEFIKNNENNEAWKKKDSDRVHITILNEPNFEVDAELFNILTKERRIFIVNDTDYDRFNKFMEYVCVPGKMIKQFCEISRNNYPFLKTNDDIYALYSHPDFDSLAKQMNYIRF